MPTARDVTVRDVIAVLEKWAPIGLAEPWDNVGLLAGDPAAEVRRVGLTIDLTPAVADELAAAGAQMVVAYHPPIFKPLRRIEAGSALARVLRAGMALYSPHTALDAADGGTNDVLLDVLGVAPGAAGGRKPLRLTEGTDRDLKLVTFVPEGKVDDVAAALFAAGAGRIGDYTSCSFRTAGTGTFFGEEGSAPVVGQPGRLEYASEVKLETIVPAARVVAVVAALARAHPYEEPAFDLVRLAAPPRQVGAGRLGRLTSATSRRELLARIKAGLGVAHVLVAGPLEGTVEMVAAAAGSGGELLDAAAAQGAGLVLTGEIRHHDALAAREMTVVAALHSNSERRTLARVAEWLGEGVPGVTVISSRTDADPFRVM